MSIFLYLIVLFKAITVNNLLIKKSTNLGYDISVKYVTKSSGQSFVDYLAL